jgi:hypothetical protein
MMRRRRTGHGRHGSSVKSLRPWVERLCPKGIHRWFPLCDGNHWDGTAVRCEECATEGIMSDLNELEQAVVESVAKVVRRMPACCFAKNGI